MSKFLEQLIEQKKQKELVKLDAVEIVKALFADLKDREQDVLSRRYGLHGKNKETLEKIGQLHNLTRERVRQIESASLKKLRKLNYLEEYLQDINQVVRELIQEHGGLMRQDFLLNILTLALKETNKKELGDKEKGLYKNYFDFVISELLSENIEKVKKEDNYHISYKLKDQDTKHFDELVGEAMTKVETMKQTVKTKELLDILKSLKSYKKYETKLNLDSSNLSKIFADDVFPEDSKTINDNKSLYSFLQAIKNLDQNKFGDWGLSDWREVSPKTINDKIYLVLKNNGKPMHFTGIAERINEVNFDKKKANPATVHNELILDDRYELVGRGLYALKEWKN